MGLGSLLKKGAKAALSSTGLGVGAELLSGLFGGKSKKKQEEAQRKAAIGAAELKNQMGEDERLAKLSAGQSLLGQLTGKGFTNIDPATAAQLAQRRSYDFGKAVPEAGAGGGSSLLSGLFGGISDVAYRAGANEQDGPMSAGQPVSAGVQPTVPVATRLGGGAPVYEDPENYKEF
jgi:hypothetical protein